jgi:hypothetical protein
MVSSHPGDDDVVLSAESGTFEMCKTSSGHLPGVRQWNWVGKLRQRDCHRLLAKPRDISRPVSDILLERIQLLKRIQATFSG